MGLPATSRSIAVFPAKPDRIHRTEIRVPAIGHSDVAIKVIRVGVCGTDREIIHGQIGRAPGGSDELVIGHEVIGRVIDTGRDVSDIDEGDLVTVTVRRPDGCPACQAGQPDMCLWGDYTERGIVGRHGFMTDYFVEDRQYIVPIPESLEHVGVLVEPLTVVEKAVRQANLIQRRMSYWQPNTAIVLGAGPIGLLGTLLLRERGINVVTVARSAEPNRSARIVEQAGADYVSTEEGSLEHLHSRLDNVDLILESTGASHLAFEAMTVLGTNGVLVLLSLTGGNRTAEVPTDVVNTGLVAGNKVIVGSINAGFEDFTNAVNRLGQFEELWPGLLSEMFTDRIPFDGEVESIAAKPERGIKTLIEFES